MFSFDYQDPNEQQQQVLQGLSDAFVPATDFGRVSMGMAPQFQEAAQQQEEVASTMNQANIDAAGDIGQTVQQQQVQAPQAFQYTTKGATDTEALGEGMFAFGLAMLANASQPGANFGGALAAGLQNGATTFSGALNRNKRFENIKALEDKGFTQESIDAYIKTGDNKQLVKNPTPKNFMKTKEMNGVMYEYDERNPAATMREITRGPKQIKSSVDLGDRVQVHYTDGSSEFQQKGMSSADRARLSVANRKAAAGDSKPKWEKELIEWQDPETKEFKTMSVFTDANNPGTFVNMQGMPMELPKGAQLTSEPQLVRRTENRYKAQDEAAKLGNTISSTAAATADLLGTDVNFYRVDRFIPMTDKAKAQEVLTNAKSALMVNQYANMAGVAGASAATEKQLIDSIPSPTAAPETKANWAKKKLAYDERVLNATISQQQQRYDYVDPSLTSALEQVKAQQEQLLSSLDDFRANQSELGANSNGIVRAPSHKGGAGNAYAGAAQPQVKPVSSFDPSQVILR